jgi:ATP-binding cassette subfamily B protein
LGIILSSQEYLEKIFVSDTSRTLKTGITNGDILFKNVTFRYDKTKDAFIYENLNLELKAGKRYALIGQSGGGKTTLMKLLIGLYKPESGAIYIDNVDISHLDVGYLRENVNYINQRTNLFNESIMYNILYGNPDATEKDVMYLLQKYNLMVVYDELPDGLDSSAGINGGNLSGGMQRVTMLLRGMLKTCKILVIDEPTTGLDEITATKVQDLIVEETEGKTLIVITHSEKLKRMSGMLKLDVSLL